MKLQDTQAYKKYMLEFNVDPEKLSSFIAETNLNKIGLFKNLCNESIEIYNNALINIFDKYKINNIDFMILQQLYNNPFGLQFKQLCEYKKRIIVLKNNDINYSLKKLTKLKHVEYRDNKRIYITKEGLNIFNYFSTLIGMKANRYI